MWIMTLKRMFKNMDVQTILRVVVVKNVLYQITVFANIIVAGKNADFMKKQTIAYFMIFVGIGTSNKSFG